MPIPLAGDRSAWDVDNYSALHAIDLDEETYHHHVPLPGTNGQILVSQDGSWVVGNSLDGTYLRLDASNDPITGALEIDNDVTIIANGTSQGIYVETSEGSAYTADFEQYSSATQYGPVLYLYQEVSGTADLRGALITGYRDISGSGTYAGAPNLIYLEDLNNGAFFWVDKDGNVNIPTGAEYRINGTPIGGAVSSVNGYTGVVVLDADDIDETVTRAWLNDANLSNTIKNATSKNPPVGADSLALWDSVADALKRLSITNLSSYLGGSFAALSHTHDADEVNITDTGGYFTSTDVEGALQELGASGGGASNGWIAYSDVIPTRASADDPIYVLTFAGVDVTTILSVGRKIRWTQNGTVRHGIIHDSSFSTNTTLTVYGGTDYDVDDTGTYTISNFYYSPVHAPEGFPMAESKWTYSFSDSTDRSQASPTAGSFYNLGSLVVAVPIGLWFPHFKCVAQSVINLASTQNRSNVVALSTSTSSVSDDDMEDITFLTAPALASAAIKTTVNIKPTAPLNVTSKTNYYPIMAAGGTTTATSISFLNATNFPLRITFLDAYL